MRLIFLRIEPSPGMHWEGRAFLAMPWYRFLSPFHVEEVFPILLMQMQRQIFYCECRNTSIPGARNSLERAVGTAFCCSLTALQQGRLV